MIAKKAFTNQMCCNLSHADAKTTRILYIISCKWIRNRKSKLRHYQSRPTKPHRHGGFVAELNACSKCIAHGLCTTKQGSQRTRAGRTALCVFPPARLKGVRVGQSVASI